MKHAIFAAALLLVVLAWFPHRAVDVVSLPDDVTVKPERLPDAGNYETYCYMRGADYRNGVLGTEVCIENVIPKAPTDYGFPNLSSKEDHWIIDRLYFTCAGDGSDGPCVDFLADSEAKR